MAKKKAVKNTKKPSLSVLRRQIDKLDREIVALANQRAEVAAEAGRLKKSTGDAGYVPPREEEILAKVMGYNRGPLPDTAIRHFYRELISGCRAMAHAMRVAYLGPEYSFSHLAAMERFGQSVELVPVAAISAVFEEVVGGHSAFGVVPVENSTDGRITDTLTMFADTPAQICGEVQLRIHHHLLGRGSRSEIREVHSKPQALSQCRRWIARHLPQAKIVETASTTAAAQVARDTPGTAAVASRKAGVNYGLEILAENIEDYEENLTRFAVIGEHTAGRTKDDKTSILFEVDHRPGALADTMAVLKRNRLNMTWIESFPVPNSPGRYLFFVEHHGHQTDARVRKALASLEKKTVQLKVLGSYARMDPVG